MIPEEVENKLEHWDLFSKGNSLYTGKSWPRTLQGCIATFFDYGKSNWGVRGIDDIDISHNTDKPIVEWYNTGAEVDADKFVEYMDHFREAVTHLKLAEHEIQLGYVLKREK